MKSLATDIAVAAGALGLLALALFCTLRITHSRKMRDRSRQLTSRVLNWK